MLLGTPARALPYRSSTNYVPLEVADSSVWPVCQSKPFPALYTPISMLIVRRDPLQIPNDQFGVVRRAVNSSDNVGSFVSGDPPSAIVTQRCRSCSDHTAWNVLDMYQCTLIVAVRMGLSETPADMLCYSHSSGRNGKQKFTSLLFSKTMG